MSIQFGNKSACMEIGENGWIILWSYRTPVAAYKAGLGFRQTSEKHSPTTTRQINEWIHGLSGEYKATEKPPGWFRALAGE